MTSRSSNKKQEIYFVKLKINKRRTVMRYVSGANVFHLISKNGGAILCVLPPECRREHDQRALHVLYDSAYVATRPITSSAFAGDYMAIGQVEYAGDGAFAESRVRFVFDFLSLGIDAPDVGSLMAQAGRLAEGATLVGGKMLVGLRVTRVPEEVPIDEVATRIRHAAPDDFALERVKPGSYVVIVTRHTSDLLLRVGFWPSDYRCYHHVGSLPRRLLLYFFKCRRQSHDVFTALPT